MSVPIYRSKPDYSNLEVAENRNPLIQSYGIEVNDDSNCLEPAAFERDPNTLPIPLSASKDEKVVGSHIQFSGLSPTSNQQDNYLSSTSSTICGVRRMIFWVIIGVISLVIIAAAIGGGVGGHFTHHNNQTSSNSTHATQDSYIAALHWIDGTNTSQYCIYYQPRNQNEVFESSWSSNNQTWAVSDITDPSFDVKPNTPLTSSAGYPYTNTNNSLVKNIYFVQSSGTAIERQSPYKEQPGIWGDNNFSGLYKISKSSSLFSYWYQDFDIRRHILAVFFQEHGANSLTVGKYVQNSTNDEPWQSIKQDMPIQDGSPIAAAPVGSRRDLRLYVGGTDGTMKQYPYNVDTDILGDEVSTTFNLAPHTPICVTMEDNRNYYTEDGTLPQCAKNNGAFLTHLILFASPDRKNLTLVSWNCSSGFSIQQSRIEKLLLPDRTYLGLATTSASNLTFADNRVYVLYDEGNGPEVDEWQIPTSGDSNITGQNGPWTRLGSVRIMQ
ncbi:uncharacterized protein GGS22DRAFT_198913 [Annulohypoxylon maeteangense]|uniref:uncharacterized protein n=1 Tax=Annulohypoxylon maeteangense TaxID=1927788 RepID=UPI002007B376|nr:uncharacterized protein GGS22DRAFT_198913 [Annulohypoxylon maeteangense]KAI0886488.1 hypothetical protein GGS22DRAFT_198913 [Annulohypoxylon maeteangense]